LRVLQDRLSRKRKIFEYYKGALGDIPGISFMPEAAYGVSNRWLTCILIDPPRFGATNEDVRLALEEENIESRPLWKPMHLQPVFRNCRIRGGSVSEEIFRCGLCLPSGSGLAIHELNRIATIVRSAYNHKGG
jgi:dTDP-4-amino-4,6-dideoxygalactose transaminase